MIKLFVVDDEDIIRAGIRNCVEKRAESFTICGEAPDGEMALPLIQELKPDVLIADVCMPFIDGLALSHIVKKMMPWLHIIIVSGHDEFEYAQKAVSIGVDAYLLKPVHSPKLLAVLEDVAQRIEQEKKNYLELEENQQRDELETTILREHALSRLVVGALDLDKALEYAQRHGIELFARKYRVCQAALSGFTSSEGLSKIRLLGNRLFGMRDDIIWFLNGADQFVYIIKGDDEMAVQEAAYETAEILRHELERYLAMEVTVGIGSLVERLSELPKSLADARSVLGSGMNFQGSKILGIDDLRCDRISPPSILSGNAPLAEQLRHATKEDLPHIVDSHFGEVSDKSVDSLLFRFYLLTDLLVSVSRLTPEKSETQKLLAENPREVLSVASSVDETRALALRVLEEMLVLRSRDKEIPYGKEIRSAKKYIDTNFGDPEISLHTVAAQVGFSPTHFSAIFSQETGETFIDYLTRRRLEAAKKLLHSSTSKQQDIALQIGYNDPHYFSYVFKKHMGISPREYRNKERNI